MLIGQDPGFHLTYCTKIHPNEGWEDLFASLQTHVPALKARLSPEKPFGLGLRLSAAESLDLLSGENLPRFRDFLDRHGIYVFTVNGFPYGAFRGPSVKTGVFSPDWQEEARMAYTGRLITILAALLPPGLEGSISTLPLSYKPWIDTADRGVLGLITVNLMRVVRVLMDLREARGISIHLDLEPEADGLLENGPEAAAFFRDWLLTVGAPLLSRWTRRSLAQARAAVRTHLQVCLDTCHLAVAYEDLAQAADLFADHGIGVGKVQITSGLKVLIPEGLSARRALAGELAPFSRSPYLHQVIAQRDGGRFHQYRDLPEALLQLNAAPDRQWRIHFHMPVYVAGFAGLSTTREETRQMLRVLKERGLCRHLELETYTWEVLPQPLQANMLDCLEREYRWAMDILDLEEPAAELHRRPHLPGRPGGYGQDAAQPVVWEEGL